MTAFLLAVDNGHHEIVEQMLGVTVKYKCLLEEHDDQSSTSLQIAARRGKVNKFVPIAELYQFNGCSIGELILNQ